ncbi:MAG: glutathione S-transferase family protein [Candidatus Binatia bacterium]
MITLYGVPRSRAMRSLWMLEELGVPYENVKTNFATGDTRKPDYLKINPNGHVPALKDGDTILCESLAINLFLARKYDKGLWPRTVDDEGRTFQWSLWAMTELEEPVLTTLLNRVFFPGPQRDAAKADDAAERVKKPLAVLEGALAAHPYLLGDAFTVADLNVAAVLSWAPLAGIELGTLPKTQAWLGRCCGRPAFQRVQQLG